MTTFLLLYEAVIKYSGGYCHLNENPTLNRQFAWGGEGTFYFLDQFGPAKAWTEKVSDQSLIPPEPRFTPGHSLSRHSPRLSTLPHSPFGVHSLAKRWASAS